MDNQNNVYYCDDEAIKRTIKHAEAQARGGNKILESFAELGLTVSVSEIKEMQRFPHESLERHIDKFLKEKVKQSLIKASKEHPERYAVGGGVFTLSPERTAELVEIKEQSLKKIKQGLTSTYTVERSYLPTLPISIEELYHDGKFSVSEEIKQRAKEAFTSRAENETQRVQLSSLRSISQGVQAFFPEGMKNLNEVGQMLVEKFEVKGGKLSIRQGAV